MARTPYVTVRGAEPVPPPSPRETAMANEYERRTLTPQQQDKPQEPETKPPEEEKPPKPDPIKLEAEEINALLDTVLKTKDLPNLAVLGQAAMINLSIMALEVKEELDKRAEEARKKDEANAARLVKEAEEKRKAREKEEKEAKEKADAA